jgi:hypothetical protein
VPGAKHFSFPINGHGSRARDANQQHVDLGIHVLCHALAHPEHEQVDIEILALLRPDCPCAAAFWATATKSTTLAVSALGPEAVIASSS